MATLALEFDRASRSFSREGGAPVHALREVSVGVPAGSSLAVVGRSGSGKSTLLHLAAAIDRPTSGAVRVDGRDTASLSERERTRLRRDAIGLVFQSFHLLPHLSVIENVVLPARIAGDPDRAARARATELLERVGLADRAGDGVDGLSGGERQRVAIGRALLRRPRLLLADEPTGSLDDDTARVVADLLFGLCATEGATLVLATHDPALAARADDVRRLAGGRLVAS